MRILAIETSCDETALALIEANGGLKNPHFKILQSEVASQIRIHRPFGGVVPGLAKREHIKNLPILFKKLKNKNKQLTEKLDLLAVTIGPGLEPALWTGIEFSKNLKSQISNFKCKLVGVNHIEGHLYSYLLSQKNTSSKLQFPAIALIVSGGHTTLLLMKDLTHYKKLGETRDDAVGESFDKVARLLQLPYPGGPEIEKISKKANKINIEFPRPMIYQKNYDFSFSGLKTSVLYYLRDLGQEKINDRLKAEIASAFQKAAFDVLIAKTFKAAEEFKAKTIILAGGVAINKTLRNKFRAEIKKRKTKIDFFPADPKFCTDNAVMIATAAYINELRNKKHKLIADGNLNF